MEENFYTTNLDKEAETIALEPVQKPNQRTGLRELVSWTESALLIQGKKLDDSDWPERFQECLEQENVRLNLDNPGKRRSNTHLDDRSYYTDCIKYILCAAEFMRTDLSEQGRLYQKTQNELWESMLLAGHLQCDLQGR